MTQKKTEFVSGLLHWAKVLGEPVPNYEKTAREWTLELELDKAGIQVLKGHALADRIKGKGYNIGQKGQFAEREPFIQLKKAELSKEGKENPPIRVYDNEDVEWDKTKLIGNESKADVKLDIRDYGVGKKKGIYPVAIRVTDHVPYQSSEFGGMDREAAQAPKKRDQVAKDFDLEDDVPF